MHRNRGQLRLEGERLEYGGDHDRDLEHGDLHADASARPGAEGHPRVSMTTRKLSWRYVEAPRVEDLRVGPHRRGMVYAPHRYLHPRTSRDVVTSDDLIVAGAPVHPVGTRKEAHAFPQEAVGPFQLRDVVGCRRSSV